MYINLCLVLRRLPPQVGTYAGGDHGAQRQQRAHGQVGPAVAHGTQHPLEQQGQDYTEYLGSWKWFFVIEIVSF